MRNKFCILIISRIQAFRQFNHHFITLVRRNITHDFYKQFACFFTHCQALARRHQTAKVRGNTNRPRFLRILFNHLFHHRDINLFHGCPRRYFQIVKKHFGKQFFFPVCNAPDCKNTISLQSQKLCQTVT